MHDRTDEIKKRMSKVVCDHLMKEGEILKGGYYMKYFKYIGDSIGR